LSALKITVEQARTTARTALGPVADIDAPQITIKEAEKAKIEAYVAKADAFL
jgi:hypothetical protein